MYTSSARYAKLTQQVANSIESEIGKGLMRGELPGERSLALSLQVSRRTIRSALEILRKKGVLQTQSSKGTVIVGAARVAPTQSGSIGLILPASLDQLRPHTTIFIDTLRTLLGANGFRLQEHVGHRYYSGRPGAALERMISQSPHDAWLLGLSNRPMQAWFQGRGIPAVIAGTPHAGIDLRSVDMDLMANCRHAAMYLIRKGHSRIALVIEESDKGGDRVTEAGFLEGAANFGRTDITALIHKHRGTTESIRKLVSRVLASPAPPTAFFIANPYHYLAVASALAKAGRRVPEDVSLICRDDDLFLHFLVTEPCRYLASPTARANAIFAALMAAIRGDGSAPQRALLLPEFFEGDSVVRWVGP